MTFSKMIILASAVVALLAPAVSARDCTQGEMTTILSACVDMSNPMAPFDANACAARTGCKGCMVEGFGGGMMCQFSDVSCDLKVDGLAPLRYTKGECPAPIPKVKCNGYLCTSGAGLKLKGDAALLNCPNDECTDTFCCEEDPQLCTTNADGETCENGGTATGLKSEDLQSLTECKCQCTSGFKGGRCETAQPCTLGPNNKACENEGEVEGEGNNCACKCKDITKYKGENCEIGLPCDASAVPEFALNAGDCTDELASGAQCQPTCMSFFEEGSPAECEGAELTKTATCVVDGEFCNENNKAAFAACKAITAEADCTADTKCTFCGGMCHYSEKVCVFPLETEDANGEVTSTRYLQTQIGKCPSLPVDGTSGAFAAAAPSSLLLLASALAAVLLK